MGSYRTANIPVLQVMIVGLLACGLSGCGTIRALICDCEETSCSDDTVACRECSCGANCAAPVGCGATPYSAEIPGMMPEMQLPPVGAQSEAEQWAPRSTWLPPVQSGMQLAPAASSAAACDAQLRATKAEFNSQLAALEARFEAESRAKNNLNSSLESMNGEMARLSREVEFWRDEVRRIDRTTEAQHRSDMASLQSISSMIDSIATPPSGSR